MVNLLLSGKAAANVFDGNIDLGEGMFVTGISTPVEIGFLTLLESFRYCNVGQHLKRPKCPIWVLGSESHYTVLFSLDAHVQDENELQHRESEIQQAFDSWDESGGGGFVSTKGFHQVVNEAGIRFPPEKIASLCSTDFLLWTDFWQAVRDLDRSLGGMRDLTESNGKNVFDLYHFNGIAKSVVVGRGRGSSFVQDETEGSVPPRWIPEEFMVVGPPDADVNDLSVIDNLTQLAKPSSAACGGPIGQEGPLVNCVRTRWPRAVCSWEGDAPSID